MMFCFTSLDCSGQAYTKVNNRFSGWSISSFFTPSFVAAVGANRTLYRVNVEQGQVAVVGHTYRDTNGTCLATGDNPFNGYPLEQEAALSTLYPAPLSIQ